MTQIQVYFRGGQYKQRGEYEITLGKHSGRPRHNKAFDEAIELSDRLIRLNRLIVITPLRIGTIKEKMETLLIEQLSSSF